MLPTFVKVTNMQAAFIARKMFFSFTMASNSPSATKCAYVYDGYQFLFLTPTNYTAPFYEEWHRHVSIRNQSIHSSLLQWKRVAFLNVLIPSSYAYLNTLKIVSYHGNFNLFKFDCIFSTPHGFN